MTRHTVCIIYLTRESDMKCIELKLHFDRKYELWSNFKKITYQINYIHDMISI